MNRSLCNWFLLLRRRGTVVFENKVVSLCGGALSGWRQILQKLVRAFNAFSHAHGAITLHFHTGLQLMRRKPPRQVSMMMWLNNHAMHEIFAGAANPKAVKKQCQLRRLATPELGEMVEYPALAEIEPEGMYTSAVRTLKLIHSLTYRHTHPSPQDRRAGEAASSRRPPRRGRQTAIERR